MPYVQTAWTNGASPALNATNLNKIEAGIFAALRTDGTNTMSGQLVTTAGTVSAPAIAPTGDLNNGIYFPSTDMIALTTAGTERLRVNATGNIGLGVSSNISNKVTVSPEIKVIETDSANTAAIALDFSGSVSRIRSTINGSGTQYPLGFFIGSTQQMLLDTSGRLGVGVVPNVLIHGKSTGEILRLETTSTTGDNYIRFYAPSTTTKGFIGYVSSANNGLQINNALNDIISFAVNNTEAARITPAGTSGYLLVNYSSSNGGYPLQVNGQIFATNATIATTSDERYKENISSLENSLDIVKALNPVQFNWKKHPVHNFITDVPRIGFLAQEVQQALQNETYLNSIIQTNETEYEKDGVIVKEEFLTITEGSLIAILTKAVKELTEKVEALEAQLANK